MKKQAGKHQSIPFTERSGKVRNLVDAFTTIYPRFTFGGALGNILPVFHFHEVSAASLEARLLYLAENGYRTVTSEAISCFVHRAVHPGRRAVALCFDDAWASLWTVAAPLLRKYGFSAITFAIPGRITGENILRPTIEDGMVQPEMPDRSEQPFVTWLELRALHASGVIDVQCHTLSHSQVFCSSQTIGFVTPEYEKSSLLSRPLVSQGEDLSFLKPSDLGAPLYPQRSRMSDGLRFFEDVDVRNRCQAYVAAAGGKDFFIRPAWRKELGSLLKISAGVYESSARRDEAILEELVLGRRLLNERLNTDSVRHICFPWMTAGEAARQALKRAGFETAFSNRVFGLRAVKAGDHPYQLMRLSNDFIFCLPGSGRRFFRWRKQ